jgi:6-phosphogluconate dehydrogenase
MQQVKNIIELRMNENKKSDVGLIGLAVMGANFARNIANNGFSICVYNRTTSKTEELIDQFGNENLIGAHSLEEFVEKLKRPRKILLLVKSGSPVDKVIDKLLPLLEEGDIIVDLGNSNYRDSEERQQRLQQEGIEFMGSGLSGGEVGALEGPSIMPGGKAEAWKELKPVLSAVAAKDFSGNACVTYVGPGGAGHYVKMVHNGIEYGMMQILAEVYNIYKQIYNYSPPQIAEIFSDLNNSKVASYLVEISAKVLDKRDDQGKNGYLIDYILDSASDKGTGRWTVQEAVEIGAPVPNISAGVFARLFSSQMDRRRQLDEYFTNNPVKPEMAVETFTDKLESALYGAFIATYAQGFHQIEKASSENGWQIDLAEIARIWQGGCIIRAELLQAIENAYRSRGNNMHLLEIESIQPQLKFGIDEVREISRDAIRIGIPVPGLSNAITYFDSITASQSAANFIQGLRDYFGSHGYKRTDKEGVFHTEWQD